MYIDLFILEVNSTFVWAIEMRGRDWGCSFPLADRHTEENKKDALLKICDFTFADKQLNDKQKSKFFSKINKLMQSDLFAT